MMKIISYTFLLIIVLLGITFACLNAKPVMIHYYIGDRELPLSLLLVLTLALGAIVAFFICLLPIIRLKAENYRLRQKIKVAEKEVENLRTMPIKDDR